jgi:hypothetical protein
LAKRDRLHLSPHQNIETGRDWNGRYFIAYSGGASVFIRDLKELRRFLKVPKGIPSRESLDSWLASLEAMDKERQAKREHLPQASEGLSEELLATGFGPEVHALDESDPNFATKTVI